MKAKIISILIVNLCVVISCSKDRETKNATASGYWTLDETKYNIVSTTRNNTSGYFILSCIDSFPSEDTLQVFFTSTPTVSGEYTIVQFEDGTLLAPDEIGIKISCPSTGVYFSTGIANMKTWPWPLAEKANLTLENEKIKIEIPKNLTRIQNLAGNDSIELAGIIFE